MPPHIPGHNASCQVAILRPTNIREACITEQKLIATSIASKRNALQAALDRNEDPANMGKSGVGVYQSIMARSRYDVKNKPHSIKSWLLGNLILYYPTPLYWGLEFGIKHLIIQQP